MGRGRGLEYPYRYLPSPYHPKTIEPWYPKSKGGGEWTTLGRWPKYRWSLKGRELFGEFRYPCKNSRESIIELGKGDSGTTSWVGEPNVGDFDREGRGIVGPMKER